MEPKLLTISGPLRKHEFALKDEVALGSDADNFVRMDDPEVSPHHCRIAVREGRYILSDLNSCSGTLVNGIPVRQRELKAGDEITVGNSVFLFQMEESGNAASSAVQLDEGESLTAEAVELQTDVLLNLQPESLAALPQPARVARNLSALLRISRAIGSLRDEESLPWQLLGLIFDVIPAERGAILLTEEDSLEVRSQVAWDRVLGPDHPVHVSQVVVRRVMEEGVSLIDSGGADGKSDAPEEGKERRPRRAFLCVPMMSSGRAIGIIYLESSSPATTFTQDDLQLLSAIAGLGVIGIENARQFERLGSENQRLRAEVSLTHDMVGGSARMREVYQFIERVAPSDSTVLICGESGTGKELAARAIHQNSARRNHPFVALNCAALTETLLESELFGHEKGAFTSAVCQKKGYLEVAEGGTIFLDEIGELSPILQAKLLRVLQEREFVRVGGTRPIKINVRFLAATNKDLQKAVREEKFRADLFHRLNVISITLPALREHPDDIPALAEHFMARHAKKCSRGVRWISDQALACLTQYDWPGNIRELENAMERAVVVGSSERILPEDLPDALLESAKSGGNAATKYHEAIRNLKKQLILSALEQTGGSITEAAKQLGVHANYLHRLVRNLELRPTLRKQTGA
ncbi:MAG: sigma 54-interacting transcriptional regulator [Candidatus Acidiferrum sp.]